MASHRTRASPDTSTVLPSNRLHGLVELRANVNDPELFVGFLADNPAWPTAFTPTTSPPIRDARTGTLIMNRISFQADQLPRTRYIVHYAPGTIEDDNVAECVGPPALKCAPPLPTVQRCSHAGIGSRSTGSEASVPQGAEIVRFSTNGVVGAAAGTSIGAPGGRVISSLSTSPGHKTAGGAGERATTPTIIASGSRLERARALARLPTSVRSRR
jgi:hypothetical protein